MSFVYLSIFLSLFSIAYSRPQGIPIITPTEPTDITNTVCGDIVVSNERAKEQGSISLFWASDVFECLKNVPFIDAVALRFLDYYNQTLSFQSTLAYLKDPPEGYQQPPVDVLLELESIKEKVASGGYASQYVFEADLQLLINRMHDAHVYLSAGAMAPFAFVSPYGLVSASKDGKEPPAVYLQSDVISSQREGWEPSPITQINGVDIVEYLTAFAELNSEGYLEPHADWNALMEHPARDIQGGLSVLQSATFYPGDELTFTYGNGSEIETFWLATYSEAQSTGPLTTAGDFYNYFVLGILPESFDEENPKWWPDEQEEPGEETGEDGETTQEPEPDYGCTKGNPSWCTDSMGAYPTNPDIVQEDLKVTAGGVVTGYFLDDISTGVLSIPTFYQTGNDTEEFFITVDAFIGNATDNKIKKVIIDLQQNSGGLNFLAISTFKRFFYTMEPDTGSRIRSHEVANILGNKYSEWWSGLDVEDEAESELYQYFAGSEWVATNRINPATGSNFSSWAEYYGPVAEHDDTFSQRQLYNLSDQYFDASVFQGWIPYGYGISADPNATAQPWAAEDIVILTDGLCSSACAYFVELMSHQAGVKTVVVGGRPTTGPMQTASGNRGARLYSAESLDYDILNVNETLEDPVTAARLPNRDDTGMWINFAGFNIRDQVRESDNIPLQFRYEAADCRIYYTLANVYNTSQLWRDAAAAIWSDQSLCVEGSTGYAPSRNSPASKPPPPRTAQAPIVDFTTTLGNISPPELNISSTTDLVNVKTRRSISSKAVVPCPDSGTCGGATECQKVQVTCPDRGQTKKFLPACLPQCSSVGAACSGDMECKYTSTAESKRQLPPKKGVAGSPPTKFQRITVYNGFCQPTSVDTTKFPSLGCPRAGA